MKKLIYLLVLILFVFGANAQTLRPANSPSPNSPTGYSLVGYVRADSGYIWKQRDTFPARFPTIVWHPDGEFYKTLGNGARWTLFASSTAGTVSFVGGLSPVIVTNSTTTPTVSVDTFANGLATKNWLYKVSDSLGFVKLNVADTLSMLVPYLRKSDTTVMLSNYLRKSDTTGLLSGYVRNTRTINTNAPLFGGGDLSTNRTFGVDTGRTNAQLVTGGSLTAVKDSLLSVIASSGGGTVLSVATTDGYGVISSVANSTSTPNISLRVDTLSVSTRDWRQKGIDSVQANLTAGLALKLNLSDTAAMLSNRFKISDTLSMLLPYLRKSDTSNMLSPYRRTSTKITNSDLVNSTISGVSLGSNLNTLSFGTYLQGGASSYNGATAVTISTNATPTNVGSTLVARDENGDFSARNISATNFLGTASTASTVAITNDISTNATYYPMFSTVTTGSTSTRVSSSKLTYNPSTGNLSATTFTGNLIGNASSASVLQTPRTINGVAFDGSANITISASVTNSLTAGYGISGSSYDGSLARTWNIDTALMIPYTDTNFVYGIATKSFVRSLGYGTGTVTSVATNNGSGITGGTITSTGTIAADTSILSTKANVVGLLVGYTTTAANALKLNISDTATMLSNYRRKTTLIENSDLRNSTISGVSLGNNLSGLINSYGISGSIYNGSAAQIWFIDTSLISTKANVTGALVAKLNIFDTAAMLSGLSLDRVLANGNTSGRDISVGRGAFSYSGSSNTVDITHSSGAGIGLNITKGGNGEGLYVNKTSGSGNAATIIGTLNATTLVKSGGTSSQFLKADGSVDNNTYLTSADIAGKLNISDTATMLSNYRRKTTLIENADLRNSAITINGTSTSLGGSISVGTVTSVSAGTGMSFTTITSSGAVNADTTVLATRAYAAGLDVAKANTSLNNVNGVLSSTYGGAGSVSGILKANGSGVVSAAVAGTDYVIPSALSGYLPLTAEIGKTLTGNLYLSGVSAGSRYVLLNETNAYTGNFILQAGAGSEGFGGSLVLNGHSRATKAGWVTAGISAGSLGKFAVNNQGLGNGTDVFTVGHDGVVTATAQINGTSAAFSGNVNLATNGGATRISLGGTAFVTDEFLNISSNSDNHSQIVNIKELNSLASGTPFIVMRKSDDTFIGLLRRVGTDNAMLVTGNSYLALGSGNTENARFSTNGNLLIKTTTESPNNEALQVAGSGLFSGNLYISGGAITNVGNGVHAFYESNFAQIQLNGATGSLIDFSTSGIDSKGRIIYTNATDEMQIRTNNATALTLSSTQAATFSSSVTASGFIKSGSSDSYFLLGGGGHVLTSTYATAASIGNGTLTLNVSGSGLSGSQSFTANQSGNATFTVTSNATTAATASTIAYRDGSGNLNAVGFFESSSIKLKDVYWQSKQSDNIDFIGFKWKKELNLDSKKHLGVIAEQVEKVLPDAVNIGENGVKSVNYNEVIIYKLEKLTNRVAELEKKLEQITKKAKK